MNTISEAIKESIINDRLVSVVLHGTKPIDIFEGAKDASPDFDENGNELDFDWNEIGDQEYDIWAISENETAGSENYFWRINVRIEI